eukprot:scaffold159588_cov26-Tisochrysis_lutea.AAC.2
MAYRTLAPHGLAGTSLNPSMALHCAGDGSLLPGFAPHRRVGQVWCSGILRPAPKRCSRRRSRSRSRRPFPRQGGPRTRREISPPATRGRP